MSAYWNKVVGVCQRYWHQYKHRYQRHHKTYEGRDLQGNLYFTVRTRHSEDLVRTTRIVEYKEGLMGDPSTVDMEWMSWLRRQREEPPTEEELNRQVVEQQRLQARVRLLKQQDDKLRMQEIAERRLNGVTTHQQGDDMSSQAMMDQLMAQEEMTKKRLSNRAPLQR